MAKCTWVLGDAVKIIPNWEPPYVIASLETHPSEGLQWSDVQSQKTILESPY